MLGPADLRDWTYCEDDALRAEIRLLAVADRERTQGTALGVSLSMRLRAFQAGADLDADELRQLCAGLTASKRHALARTTHAEMACL